ncbi:hypothetical protein A6R68_00163, partial [Neotoma lepida]
RSSVTMKATFSIALLVLAVSVCTSFAIGLVQQKCKELLDTFLLQSQ